MFLTPRPVLVLKTPFSSTLISPISCRLTNLALPYFRFERCPGSTSIPSHISRYMKLKRESASLGTRAWSLFSREKFEESNSVGPDLSFESAPKIFPANEAKTSNASIMACDYGSNVALRSETVVQKNEMHSFGDYQTPKVRKPYTIVKQREKWT
ncbi:hypothetical protein CJ030_MR5G012372 [Morella rubra]|uniref:Uncharacterized protein n=1 Tax=Morella rubra TaxID=262757 RepID=A0A6A1VSD0_9ROSI|nr:hypothetical protein CJ030_MR5G012372 [Morella rubra]